MKTKLAIVVDSTTILPEEIKSKYKIVEVALSVSFGTIIKSEFELTDKEIVAKLDDPKSMKSCSPSTGDFAKVYTELFEEGYEDILVFTLSKEISGTYQAANMARDLVEGKEAHIYVVDTNFCNYGVANIILSILPLVDTDITFAELIEKTNEHVKNSDLMFTILDLKHLFRGGRLSKISCAIGLLFKIKPVIVMEDGKLKLAYKMRTKINIVDLFIGKIDEYAAKYKKVYLRFINLCNPEVIEEMTKTVSEKHSNVEITSMDRVGPVFLVHLGNNGYGISLTGVND